MSQYRPHNFEIPEETMQVARAAFPKQGCSVLRTE